MPASSDAVTATSPTASTVESSTDAVVAVETLLLARTPAALLPVAFQSAEATELAAFDTVAFSRAAPTAPTVTPPPACTVERVSAAVVAAGSSPLNAEEISGSPSSASTALKRMFDGFQPIEL